MKHGLRTQHQGRVENGWFIPRALVRNYHPLAANLVVARLFAEAPREGAAMKGEKMPTFGTQLDDEILARFVDFILPGQDSGDLKADVQLAIQAVEQKLLAAKAAYEHAQKAPVDACGCDDCLERIEEQDFLREKYSREAQAVPTFGEGESVRGEQLAQKLVESIRGHTFFGTPSQVEAQMLGTFTRVLETALARVQAEPVPQCECYCHENGFDARCQCNCHAREAEPAQGKVICENGGSESISSIELSKLLEEVLPFVKANPDAYREELAKRIESALTARAADAQQPSVGEFSGEQLREIAQRNFTLLATTQSLKSPFWLGLDWDAIAAALRERRAPQGEK